MFKGSDVTKKFRRFYLTMVNDPHANRRFFGLGIMLTCILSLFISSPQHYTIPAVVGWFVLWMLGAFFAGFLGRWGY